MSSVYIHVSWDGLDLKLRANDISLVFILSHM